MKNVHDFPCSHFQLKLIAMIFSACVVLLQLRFFMQEWSSGLLCGINPSTESACRKTGGENKQENNALPRPFFYVGEASSTHFGAVLATELYQEGTSSNVAWRFRQHVELETPIVLTADSYVYGSAAMKLKATLQTQARTAPVKVGGAANHHFLTILRKYGCA